MIDRFSHGFINSVYKFNDFTLNELLCKLAQKMDEVITQSNESFNYLEWLKGQGLSDEVIKIMLEWKEDGTLEKLINIDKINRLSTELNNRIDNIENSLTIKTPEDYGAKGDGITDDSEYVLLAMTECANNNYTLTLRNKYRIGNTIVYNGWKPLVITGTAPNDQSLLNENESNGMANLLFDENCYLEINKMGSVTFKYVGFEGISKGANGGLVLKSFRNKIVNCYFARFKNCISCLNGATNWLGENQTLFNTFSRSTSAYYSETGSDSEFIGNLIHSSCDMGFNGTSSGYLIANNHFYNTKPSYFKAYNTRIINNYIQECILQPTIIVEPTFGCMIQGNNFELEHDENETRLSPKGLIQIISKSGYGNLTISNNSLHGRSLDPYPNLALIDMKAPVHDMPMQINDNNLINASALFTKNYPFYNVNGGVNVDNMLSRISVGGTIDTSVSKCEVYNGIVYGVIKLTNLTNATVLTLPNRVMGTMVTTEVKWKTSSTKNIYNHYVPLGQSLYYEAYNDVEEMTITFNYVLQHLTSRPYNL